MQKFQEWLLNEPQGTQQQEFVQRMRGSIEREKMTAESQIKRVQMQRAASRYGKLEKEDPDAFYDSLQGLGIEKDEYQKWKKGGMKPTSAVQAPDGESYSSTGKPMSIDDHAAAIFGGQ
jgi:hypothetical protein